ncbi:class IV adenylate cyclase [Staphylococcus simulans]
MKELEVRFKIDTDKNLSKLLSYLSENYDYIDSTIQKDSYYKEYGKEKEGDIPGSYILRIREESKQFLATKKETVSKGLWIESEVKLDESQLSFFKDVLNLGFKRIMVIDKKREAYKQGNITINIDNIKGLGQFLEAEMLGDFSENDKLLFTQKVKNEFSFLKPKVVTEGYVQMMREKNEIN